MSSRGPRMENVQLGRGALVCGVIGMIAFVALRTVSTMSSTFFVLASGSPLAILLGVRALAQRKSRERGAAIAGIALGIVACVLWAVVAASA
jgi:hypothetical protein